MTNPAGPDKDRIEVVPMLPEKPELETDDVDFRKGQERVQTGAGQEEGEHCDPGIQGSPTGRKFGPRPIEVRFREKHGARADACDARIPARGSG